MPVYEFKCLNCQKDVSVYRPPTQRYSPKYCSNSCYLAHKRATHVDRVDRDMLYDLYIKQRLSCREIGERLGVTTKLVKDYLKRHAIPTRTAMETRSPNAIRPSADELHRMYWGEFKSYVQIAEICGVDATAVPYWLKKYGIPRRKNWETHRKRIILEPTKSELVSLYTDGGYSARSIGDIFHLSSNTILRLLSRYGIEKRLSGYNQARLMCSDGHIVMSKLEHLVDEWLYAHGIPHDYESPLPFGGKCDFLVDDYYIEIWGIVHSDRYSKRQREKIEFYRQRNMKLIELYPIDTLRHLDEKLDCLLTRDDPRHAIP